MDRVTHHREAYRMITRTINSYQSNDLTAAGEALWGAVVNAISAADPEHEKTQATQSHNLHAAPYTGKRYYEAAERVNNISTDGNSFSHNDAVRCITSGQQYLHNNFYHANLSGDELTVHIGITWGYVDRIMTIANQALLGHLISSTPTQR